MDEDLELWTMIAEFLAEERPCDAYGGWGKVCPDDMEQLYGIIEELIAQKWKRDMDGDLPIEVELVNRKEYEPLHAVAVHYWHKAKTDQERETILRDHLINARMANENVRTCLDLMLLEKRFQERDKEEKV